MAALQSLGSVTITSIALAIAALYMLPALIGVWRAKRSQWAIFAFNLLLGWTLIGWGVALIWACGRPKAKRPKTSRSKPLPRRPKKSAIVANDNAVSLASSLFQGRRSTPNLNAGGTWPTLEAEDDYADWLNQGFVRSIRKGVSEGEAHPAPSDRRIA